MDNQIFPGGAFLDDIVCPLCGIVFNNNLTLQHHMQLHIYNAQILGNQPPDTGLGLNAAAAANILDLIAGVSSASSTLAPGPGMFTSVPSVPPHLISPSLGIGAAPLQPVPLTPPVPKVKEKKVKTSTTTSKSAPVVSSLDPGSVTSLTPRTVVSGGKSRDVVSTSFLPNFSKDPVTQSKNAQSPVGKMDRPPPQFHSTLSQFDQIEEALGMPTFSKTPFDHQSTSSAVITPQVQPTKDTTKLFQPFATSEDPLSMGFLSKTAPSFSADHLVSPVKSGIVDKPLDLDVLSTPQKVSYHGSSDSLSSSPKSSVSSDFRKTSAKTAPSSIADSHSIKPPFYPGLLDPLNISPKSSKVFRENPPDIAIQSSHFGGNSRSSSPKSSKSNEIFPSPNVSTAAMLSPKVSGGVAGVGETVPGKIFSSDEGASATPGIPPTIFGNTTGIINPTLGVPDITNPLATFSNGTGYFNSLTQKLINPGLSIGSDFNKMNPSPGSSFASGSQKSKIYFENGTLINQDYDKISDTNDEDDLERLIDDYDTKDDHIDSKGYSEIEDLLNEFNENHPDELNKNKNQVDDFLDVFTDTSRIKLDTKSETSAIIDPIDCSNSAITELIENEKEKIEKESKMLESARLNVSIVSETVTTSTVTTTDSVVASTSSSVTVSSASQPTAVVDSKPEQKKDDDPIDFEIPKVGKLMKIRKYFESQEQKKKKEQTESEKEAEIKVREKCPAQVEEKPQTILVQVSKRKKIEYGPYINRQSLLEGKPVVKEPETVQKTFRPKPKPQVPVRRTFNLRTRKTKTDFASLANRGSKTPEVKKSEEKSPLKTPEKAKTSDKVVENKPEGNEETNVEESKIVTRNKEKAKKETESNQNEKEKTMKFVTENDKDAKKDENKPTLRTRSAKVDAKVENTESESKNLRKRTVKTSSDSLKIKITKQDEPSKTDQDSDEKSLRKNLRSKKTTPDKADIKMCSVNLGENLSELKIKTAMRSTKDAKESEKNRDNQVGKDKQKSGIEQEKVVPETSESQVESVKVKLSTRAKGKQGGSSRIKQTVETTQKQISEAEDVVDTGLKKDDNTESMEVDNENNEEKEEFKVEEKLQMNMKEEESMESKQENSKIPETDLDSNKSVTETTEVKVEEHPEVQIEKDLNKHNDSENVVEKVPPVFEKVTVKIKLNAEFHRQFKESLREFSSSKKRKLELQKEKETVQKEKEEETVQKEKEKETVQVSLEPRVEESFDQQQEKKVKHSVENEFQRLVDEAMAEVKNAAQKGDSGKSERYSNLRKRLNDSVRYNVDDSEDEHDGAVKVVIAPPAAKVQKQTPKLHGKVLGAKTLQKPKKTAELIKTSVKKDVDVYDFTDTEMSDKEDEGPTKISFKPKYVSNVKGFGQSKIPFVSKPVTSPNDLKGEDEPKNEIEEKKPDDNNEDNDEISYIGKTVEPLKIKLTKIIPYKEKRHKHKKKKRRKEKRRRDSKDSNETSDTLDKVDDVEKKKDGACEDLNVNEGNEEESESPSSKGVKKTKLKEKKLLEKKHICVFCNQGFGQKCDLRKHVMIHTGERPYPCDICDKKFLRKTDLVKHTRTHTGEKPYACEFCDKRVSDKSQLNVHRRLHTGDRPYQCTKCGKGCITSSELTRHRSVHCSEKPYTCELCKKTFKIKECLGIHMKMHYWSRTRKLQCETCAFGFDRSVDLEKHKCSALSPSTYICAECSEEFNDEMMYAEHIKTHNLDVYSCNMCTHIFEDKTSLETHLCSLSSDKPKFQCDFCDEEFANHDALSQHISVHDDDTGSFMCDLCSEIFTVRRQFITHAKYHEEVKTEASPCDVSKLETGTINAGGSKIPSRHAFDQFRNHLPAGVIETGSGSGNGNSVESSNSACNNTRASVISGSFRNLDSSVARETKVRDVLSEVRSAKPDLFDSQLCGRTDRAKPKFLSNDKFFETSEFSNSPDFSSLTEEGNISIDPFHKLSPTEKDLQQDQRPNDRGLNVSNSNTDSFDFNSDLNNAGRVAKVDMKAVQNYTSDSHGQPDFRWSSSYQMSANDYVNSLLNKMGSGETNANADISSSKSFGVKSESQENLFPKNEAMLSMSQEADSFKNNIENQPKSNIFSDFDFPIASQKPDGFQTSVSGKSNLQQKFGSSSSAGDSMAFQGIDQNLYNLPRNRHFSNEKSDYSHFSSSFLSSFSNNALYNSNASSSLFGHGSHEDPKRASSSTMFGANQDVIQSNFFLGVEESLKGTSPNDKADETAALLSNFDYNMN